MQHHHSTHPVGKIAKAMRADSFRTTGREKKSILQCSFRCNFVSGEKGRKKRKRKYGKRGTFASAGIQANERVLSTYWHTQKKRVVNEECKRVHYDNMQHNIKSFVLLLARAHVKGLPVSNDSGLDVCV